jgi:hypothetical protein
VGAVEVAQEEAVEEAERAVQTSKWYLLEEM